MHDPILDLSLAVYLYVCAWMCVWVCASIQPALHLSIHQQNHSFMFIFVMLTAMYTYLQTSRVTSCIYIVITNQDQKSNLFLSTLKHYSASSQEWHRRFILLFSVTLATDPVMDAVSFLEWNPRGFSQTVHFLWNVSLFSSWMQIIFVVFSCSA